MLGVLDGVLEILPLVVDVNVAPVLLVELVCDVVAREAVKLPVGPPDVDSVGVIRSAVVVVRAEGDWDMKCR